MHSFFVHKHYGLGAWECSLSVLLLALKNSMPRTPCLLKTPLFNSMKILFMLILNYVPSILYLPITSLNLYFHERKFISICKLLGCGRRLLADNGGEITSFNYPSVMRYDVNCSWIISTSQIGKFLLGIILQGCPTSRFRGTFWFLR